MNSLSPQQHGYAVGKARYTGLKQHVAAAVLAAFTAACATSPPPKPAEEIVKERAQARWNALVQGDVKTAYDFFSPGSRSTTSLADFAGGIRIGFWKAVTVEKVECSSADRCDAHSNIEYDYRGTRIKTPHREVWVKDGSQWWYLRR